MRGPNSQARDLPALIEEIKARRNRAHSWQRGFDCVSFALACVEAQTGVDLLDGIATWSNRTEALAVAKSLGGLVMALDQRMDRIAPASARRGDVAALPCRDFGLRLMVVEGDMLIGPGSSGLERLPRAAMRRAWDAASARAVR